MVIKVCPVNKCDVFPVYAGLKKKKKIHHTSESTLQVLDCLISSSIMSAWISCSSAQSLIIGSTGRSFVDSSCKSWKPG